jgi:tetratricopeptide (TPR) repeat protein
MEERDPRLKGAPMRSRGLYPIVAVLFFALLAGAWALRAPARAADEPATIDRAQSAFQAHNYRQAVTILDAYILAHPRDPRAFVLRGDAKASLADNHGALRDYDIAIGIDPEYAYAYETRCETRLQLDDTEGALADCNTSIRLDPTSSSAYEDRADVYFNRDQYATALADYDHAIALGRTGAYVYAARCDTNRLTGNRTQAASDCERALVIDPQSRRGLWARARLEETDGKYQMAIADFNAYIALKPEASDTGYYYRGQAYNHIQSFKLALADLDVYVGRAPNDPDGYVQRAVARYGLADKAGAVSDLIAARDGYRKAGQTSDADKTAAMLDAVRAGTAILPP